MLPNCTTLCIMNKTMKQKQNAQSEMYDYDFKTKIKCTTIQKTPLDEYRSSHEVISQTIDKILNKIQY